MAKRPDFSLGSGGCSCSACVFTASFMLKGFAHWPKGARATPAQAKRIYTAHVNFNWRDARKRVGVGPSGAGFYGVPAGSTSAEVERTLRASFVGVEVLE